MANSSAAAKQFPRGKPHWLVEFAINNGISKDELVAAIHVLGVQTDGTVLDMPNYILLLNWMVERLEEPALGIRLAREIRASEFGSGLLLVYHAATIRDCCQSAARYDQIISPGVIVDFVEGKKNSRLEYRINLPASVDVSQEVEFGIAVITNFSRHQVENGFEVETCFMHKPNASLAQYHAAFGPKVLFEQPKNAVVFSNEFLDQPISNADPNMLEILRDHADSLREQALQKTDLLEQVRFFVARTLGSGDCTADVAASFLNMSRRNLTRRLNSHRTNFRELRNEITEEVAKQALKETDSTVTEIAMRLGYSETSAFDRAFKTLTGYTPLEYRQND